MADTRTARTARTAQAPCGIQQIAVHGARSPQARFKVVPVPAGARITTCQMSTYRPLRLLHRDLRANLQRRCGVGLRFAALFLPASSSSFISSHLRISGGIWAVGVPARAVLQCLIGHFRLRRSLNIVQAPAHARSGSSKLRPTVLRYMLGSASVRALACSSGSGTVPR